MKGNFKIYTRNTNVCESRFEKSIASFRYLFKYTIGPITLFARKTGFKQFSVILCYYKAIWFTFRLRINLLNILNQLVLISYLESILSSLFSTVL